MKIIFPESWLQLSMESKHNWLHTCIPWYYGHIKMFCNYLLFYFLGSTCNHKKYTIFHIIFIILVYIRNISEIFDVRLKLIAYSDSPWFFTYPMWSNYFKTIFRMRNIRTQKYYDSIFSRKSSPRLFIRKGAIK